MKMVNEALDSLRGASVKIGAMQRRLARPPRKDDAHKSRSVNKDGESRFIKGGAGKQGVMNCMMSYTMLPYNTNPHPLHPPPTAPPCNGYPEAFLAFDSDKDGMLSCQERVTPIAQLHDNV